jgi:hypothetical protein
VSSGASSRGREILLVREARFNPCSSSLLCINFQLMHFHSESERGAFANNVLDRVRPRRLDSGFRHCIPHRCAAAMPIPTSLSLASASSMDGYKYTVMSFLYVLSISTAFLQIFILFSLSKSKMASPLLFSFFLLAWTLCVLPGPTEAFWFRRYNTFHQSQNLEPDAVASTPVSSTSSSSLSYIFSLPTPSIIEPTLTSQGMIVSSIVPLYEVCNIPGLDTSSCSTVFETIVTTTCSTVLTYAFTKATISDCSQSITFSTQSSYYLATSTVSATITPAPKNRPRYVTTYVQSIVSYYIAPWQALAANTPANVTVLVCEYDSAANPTCTTIQEVWAVHTESVPAITTSTLIISTTLASVRLLPSRLVRLLNF